MSDVIEELPESLEKNLADLLMPGEEILLKCKGAFKEGLVCTNRRVLILKSGFMTGSMFGSDAFQQPYRNISGVQVKFGARTGFIEVNAGGMQNTSKSYWAISNGSDPATAPNCVSLNSLRQRDNFQQAANFILSKVEEAHAGTAQRPQPPGGASDHDALLDSLERLGRLRETGVLTDVEFAEQKAQILG